MQETICVNECQECTCYGPCACICCCASKQGASPRDGSPRPDEVPVSIFALRADGGDCDKCLRPVSEWPRNASYHPLGAPGAMFKAALYCADCMPTSYNSDGLEVRTFCGERHRFTDVCHANNICH